eukprot:TRINITY_DN35464_c0_g1_i1.p1 TRINITY_DN35464_c0_g1~~TRINITY_DN35464_c0_g1_i1.p1  ORF type:complete len:810 (+),score=243.78 TRINITY_DN35464_c0_g1_i1:61-2490(+)
MRGAIPDLSPEEAVAIAKRLYGSSLELDRAEVTAASLGSYIDQNFRLTIKRTGGAVQDVVLKLANSAESESQIDMETEAMLCLAKAPGINDRCPIPIPSDEGRYYTAVPHPREPTRKHLARVTSFLSGQVLAKIPQEQHTGELMADLGRLLGSIRRALANLKHRAAHRFLRWDLKTAGHVSPLVPLLFKDEKRALVEHFLEQFESEVTPVLVDLPQQVVHGDVNDYNLMCEGERVSGLCDFGDIVHSPAVCELGIALAYVMMDKPDPIASAAAVIAGHASTCPLVAAEIRALWWLVAARLCVSVTISAYEAHLQPQNLEYVEISARPAWALLHRMRDLSGEQATQSFLQAAGLSADQRGAPSASLDGVPVRSIDEITAIRRACCPKSLSTQYRSPLKIVRGRGCELFDDTGRSYLDCVNNVCHVGHCHPRVVAAAQQQMAALNTNTRYLHDNLAEYVQRLKATLPAGLDTVFLVNTGSEANDLAFRLATTATGRKHMLVVDHAYHGHTTSLVQISPYKYRDQAQGRVPVPENTSTVPMPDTYRGKHTGPDAGEKYAADAERVLEELSEAGTKVAAFWSESLMGVGGQIIPPDGWLARCHTAARKHGALCIADEVQVGFGRVGTGMWAFASQGGDVVPDIVTMGKPIGNGHPMAAVITKREIAEKFSATGMEYFATFGGNPVSCAVGLAVLQTVEQEGLTENAARVGAALIARLRDLQRRHRLIGDVRGKGLFIGVELVTDRDSKAPATEAASAVSERLKEKGVLVTTDGPLCNVLKIKPPIVFDDSCVRRLCTALDECLSEVEADVEKP